MRMLLAELFWLGQWVFNTVYVLGYMDVQERQIKKSQSAMLLLSLNYWLWIQFMLYWGHVMRTGMDAELYELKTSSIMTI